MDTKHGRDLRKCQRMFHTLTGGEAVFSTSVHSAASKSKNKKQR